VHWNLLDNYYFLLGLGGTHPAPEPEGIEAWINIRIIQRLVHHTSAVVVAVALFALVGYLMQRLMHDSIVKRAVLIFDEIVLVGLLVYFAYELFLYL